MTSAILGARTVSAFPLSIGTSLAFESLSTLGGQPYDPAREIPQRVQLSDYNTFWINLSTIFRNLHGSVSTDDSKSLEDRDCADFIIAELDTIEDVVRHETNGSVRIIPYISNYKRLKSLSSKALLRSYTTERQLAYTKLHDKTLQRVINTLFNASRSVKVFDDKIRSDKDEKNLILTHIAYDLLAYENLHNLDLIESHTGVLKKRNLWYTKFYQGENLAIIPFIEVMLKFYGDSHTFKPYPMSARTSILELAKIKRWSWLTTKAKVFQDLDGYKDQFLAQTIKNL